MVDFGCHEQHLRWDTSDGHLHLKHSAAFPRPRSVYNAHRVTQQIAAEVAAADRGEYKGVRTQKLAVVPPGSVLSGGRQKRASGKLSTRAAKILAIDKSEKFARGQQAAAMNAAPPAAFRRCGAAIRVPPTYAQAIGYQGVHSGAGCAHSERSLAQHERDVATRGRSSEWVGHDAQRSVPCALQCDAPHHEQPVCEAGLSALVLSLFSGPSTNEARQLLFRNRGRR